MDYASTKLLHIGCVTLSISLFALRGTLQLAGIEWRRWRVLRVAPHIVDSVLLFSAIKLAMTLHISPLNSCWLAAKVLALIGYILLGRYALRAPAWAADGVSRVRALLPFVAALLTVGYIVGVAVTHSPSWGLAIRLGFVRG
ncbi:SirB2 family protein [Uliginosibacterium sp. H3]|uniref:SirB2 family protein n=1 Tax=Uliginosibacterium silvisoli TaxID=3114758 RepID=A0ABU6K744_9RHOO|nr:SirB2 family protein [Uliginosibacterium sp. H3]